MLCLTTADITAVALVGFHGRPMLSRMGIYIGFACIHVGPDEGLPWPKPVVRVCNIE